MKIPFGAEVGLSPGDIVLNGDSAPLEKGTAPPPHFSAHVYCGEMAGWMKMPLDTEVDLGPGHIVFDEAQLPPTGKGHSSHRLRLMFIVAKWSPISATAELLLYNRKINMTFEDKIKTTYKEVTENSEVSSNNLK